MKEIGGYIQLDDYHMPCMHEKALAFNCGRNCLAWLIKSKNIQRIVLPFFLCDTVAEICIKYGCEVDYYYINAEFMPVDSDIFEGKWVYIVNYYGQLEEKQIKELVEKYKQVIVDNVQAYFDKAIEGVDTIYTCRKFFGVPDGAFLYTDAVNDYEKIPLDQSCERMHFLLGRYEGTANSYYSEYVNNNKLFKSEPIKRMSRLTTNLLHGIDYQYIKQKRTDNYEFLEEHLSQYNRLHLKAIEGAFAYPLWVENAKEIRKKMIENKIYIPLLWPNVVERMATDTLEYDMAANILPLPCDQRYGREDMLRICEVLEK